MVLLLRSEFVQGGGGGGCATHPCSFAGSFLLLLLPPPLCIRSPPVRQLLLLLAGKRQGRGKQDGWDHHSTALLGLSPLTPCTCWLQACHSIKQIMPPPAENICGLPSMSTAPHLLPLSILRRLQPPQLLLPPAVQARIKTRCSLLACPCHAHMRASGPQLGHSRLLCPGFECIRPGCCSCCLSRRLLLCLLAPAGVGGHGIGRAPGRILGQLNNSSPWRLP